MSSIIPLPHPRGNPGPFRDLLRQAADDYAERLDWCVLPVRAGTKIPAVRWGPYQTRRPSRQVRRRWFGRHDVAGLAVVHGAVSGGGLAHFARDFECRDAYREWARRHPALAATLPTSQTARGDHVYGLLPEEVYRVLGDGELRGDCRHYTLLPPSAHPAGPSYRWLTPPTGPLPVLSLSDLDIALPSPVPPPPGEEHSMSCVRQRIIPPPNISNSGWLEAVVRMTQPAGPGERNARIFDLARCLQADPELAAADPAGLLPVVERWFREAFPRVSTKDFAVTWKDFLRAWAGARRPGGVPTLAGAAGYAWRLVPGRPGGEEEREHAALLRLEVVCEELQARHGDRPFPLGCRQAGELIGVGRELANQLLDRLRQAGLLRLARDHNFNRDRPEDRRAREWWYLPGVGGAGPAAATTSPE